MNHLRTYRLSHDVLTCEVIFNDVNEDADFLPRPYSTLTLRAVVGPGASGKHPFLIIPRNDYFALGMKEVVEECMLFLTTLKTMYQL